MATKNDITGDAIISKTSEKYRDNYDKIFGKKPPEVWQHYCKSEGHLAIKKGSACNWCGIKEDGTFD
jgi:hypothetical protein